MPMQFGFTKFDKPKWETKLESTDEKTVRKTGLSKEKLKEILKVLYDNGVIN